MLPDNWRQACQISQERIAAPTRYLKLKLLAREIGYDMNYFSRGGERYSQPL
jgi:hypothetical protein